MTFFHRTDVLEAIVRASGRPLEVAVVSDGTHRYRVPVDRRGRAVTDLPFLDVVTPLPTDEAATAEVAFVDRVAVDEIDADEISDFDVTATRRLAPLLRWDTLPDEHDEMLAAAKKRSKRSYRETRKRPNNLEKHLGESVTFEVASTNTDHLDRLLDWKAHQFVSTGNPDLIAQVGRQLFHDLFDQKIAILSTITRGDDLIAGHVGVHDAGVFSYWLPSYDVDLAKYSPGNLLLEEMLLYSHRSGDREFDFLEGAERYKLIYASHARVLAPVGTPPATRRAREFAANQLQRWPVAAKSARSARDWVERRLNR